MTPPNRTATLSGFFGHYIKQQKVLFIIILSCWIFFALDQTAFPYLLGRVVDMVSTFDGDRRNIWDLLQPIIAISIFLWVFIEISFRISGFTMGHVHAKMMANVRMYLFEVVLGYSHRYFSENMPGSMARKINDMAESMERAFQIGITIIIPTFIALVIAMGIFLTVHTVFSMVLFLWVLTHIGVCIWTSNDTSKYSQRHSEKRSVLMGKMVDALSNHAAIRAFGRGQSELNDIAIYQDDERKAHKATSYFLERRKIILSLLTILGPGIGMNWYAMHLWTVHAITTGDVVLIFNTVFNLTALIWLVGIELPNAFREIGICKQALKLFQEDVRIHDGENAQPLRITHGAIAFQNVHFTHSGKKELFSNQTIDIQGGEHIGLVGASGSGKSTLINLILRLHDVASGGIFIDGQNIKDVTQKSLRDHISFIPQDPVLFNRTVMENIRFAKPDATDDEVFKAAQNAQAHDFIMDLEHGYDQNVGDKGSLLSGGQRQRISIARAFLKDAPILIMDEATSALDALTEDALQETLAPLMKGRTTLIIAHRLKTVQTVDRILVFQKGRVLQDGPHTELFKDASGLYRKLFNAQMLM